MTWINIPRRYPAARLQTTIPPPPGQAAFAATGPVASPVAITVNKPVAGYEAPVILDHRTGVVLSGSPAAAAPANSTVIVQALWPGVSRPRTR
jgi:hypothetical protein